MYESIEAQTWDHSNLWPLGHRELDWSVSWWRWRRCSHLPLHPTPQKIYLFIYLEIFEQMLPWRSKTAASRAFKFFSAVEKKMPPGSDGAVFLVLCFVNLQNANFAIKTVSFSYHCFPCCDFPNHCTGTITSSPWGSHVSMRKDISLGHISSFPDFSLWMGRFHQK